MNDPLGHLSDTAKHWIDALSLGALAATFMDLLPGLSAVMVLLWTGLRIYECLLAIKLKHRELDK